MAATEIYTLSLHDALPICQHSLKTKGLKMELGSSAYWSIATWMVTKILVASKIAVGESLQRSSHEGLYPALIKDIFLTGGLDRKSTRLNSSHPSISYAVFC